jgi:(2Fe-2S) ferredoxin
MVPFERHVFVCENTRPPDAARGCCASKGGSEVRAALKKRVVDAGLKGRVRINKAGCLDQCEQGVTLVVYPEAVWYGRVTPGDVDEIFDEHIVAGRPVERLRLDREASGSTADD